MKATDTILILVAADESRQRSPFPLCQVLLLEMLAILVPPVYRLLITRKESAKARYRWSGLGIIGQFSRGRSEKHLR